jgi:hypothetical protein
MGLIDKVKRKNKKDLRNFIRFLKENKIYSTYCKNLKSNNSPFAPFNYAYKHNVKIFFSDGDPFNWLTDCFCWAEQKEGHEFWENFHVKWQKIKMNENYRKVTKKS